MESITAKKRRRGNYERPKERDREERQEYRYEARPSARISGQEAASAFEEFIDERFPDERMERIYENMEFGEM